MALAVCLLLAGASLSSGLSILLVGAGDPRSALKLHPGMADAHTALALLDLSAGREREAADEARHALARAPLSSTAAYVLARAAEDLEDRGAAMAILGQSAALGWRDPALQALLLKAAIASNQPVLAAERLDALLRENVAPEQLTPLVDRLASDPRFREALVQRLAGRPAWRMPYLREASGFTPAAEPARSALVLALASTDAPPTHDEIAGYLTVLVREGLGGRARELWTALDPAAAGSGLLSDGGFERSSGDGNALPFEWNLASATGASATLERGPNRSRALHAVADGRSTGLIASQTLSLTPGPHRFEVSAWGGDDALGALRWTIACGDSDSPIADYGRVALAGGGARLRITFVVPATCPDEALELRAASVDPPIPIEAWFDDGAIDR